MGMSSTLGITPPKDHVKRLDRTGRRILEQVGVRIAEPRYLDLLKKAGANVDHGEARARFSGDWLDETLSKAPSKFVLYSRDGSRDIELGSGKTHFSNGGRVFRILSMGTGGYRRTALRDVKHTAALVQDLEHIDLYIIACQAHDLDPQGYHLNDFYHAMNHTTKHVMGGCDHVEGAREVYRLAEIVAGGAKAFRDRAFISVITNPISPLTIEAKTLDILDFCCNHSIPVTCAPAPISGATAPASLAGTLAQLHAEALAGVAVTQVLCPGAPILYGSVPTSMDLRSMDFTMGSVEMAMMNSMAVHLARLYNLPIYGSAGVTESKRPEIQAGVEKAFSILGVALAGADLIHLAAGMLDSGNSIAYEQYIIDDEIIGMTKRMLKGIDMSEEALAYEVIKNVGPGGNYVAEEHTVDHMMDEFFYPELAVRCNFDLWEERDRPDMLSRANKRVERILSRGVEGLFDPDTIIKIKEEFPDFVAK